MGVHKAVVKVEFVECQDGGEPGSGEPRQRADGGFETVIFEGCAMDIGGCERALPKSAYAEMRHEMGRHLTCLSKKKAVELAGGRDVDEPAHPYHAGGEVGRSQFGASEAAGGAGAPVNARGLFPPLKNGSNYSGGASFPIRFGVGIGIAIEFVTILEQIVPFFQCRCPKRGSMPIPIAIPTPTIEAPE